MKGELHRGKDNGKYSPIWGNLTGVAQYEKDVRWEI
jgi:hypothetical protein